MDFQKPGITFSIIYRISWVKLFGTKFATSGVVAVDVSGNPLLPVFGIIVQIWVIKDFVYFDVRLLQTICFDCKYQACHVMEIEDEELCTAVYAYECVVDFNVFHVKTTNTRKMYIPTKYNLNDIMVEHVKGLNPLH